MVPERSKHIYSTPRLDGSTKNIMKRRLAFQLLSHLNRVENTIKNPERRRQGRSHTISTLRQLHILEPSLPTTTTHLTYGAVENKDVLVSDA